MDRVSRDRRAAGVLRTCTSTLAIGIEARDIDAIKVVGGDSRMGEKEKRD